MKILIFNWRDIKNPEAGGAEVHLQEIFKRIVKKGHEVVLISSKFKGCSNSEIIDGINIIRVGNKFDFNFAAAFYYLENLSNEKFDVVVDDISKIPLCTPLYVRKPLCALIHHIHGKTLFKELAFPMASYVWLSERFLIPLYKGKKIISVSESTKEELIRMGIPPENIIVVHNGNDFVSTMNNEKSKIPTVVYVGRIKAYKQLDHLIKAFNIVRTQIRNSRLIIAGSGDKNSLKNLASDLDLSSSVKFYDEVPEEEKLRLLREAWILVTPSMKEGWGITVIEANARGTPAIAYDVPGLRDSIKNNETGLLVEPGNIEGLASAVIKVFDDNGLHERLIKGALEWSKNFSWDNSAIELEQVIKNEF